MHGEIYPGDLVHLHPGAETLSLPLHQLGQLLPGHGFRETRVVLYLTSKGHLPPQGAAGDEQRGQLGTASVDAGCEASRTAANNDQILHHP